MAQPEIRIPESDIVEGQFNILAPQQRGEMSDRELIEKVAEQNEEIIRLLGEGVSALQSFQSGPMGSMIGKMFGGGK